MSSISSALMSNPLPVTSTADRGWMLSSPRGTTLNETVLQAAGSSAKPGAADPARVAADFEGVFASLLLKEMRKTLEPGTMFGEDSADVYGGLFDTYLGQQMTQSGGFGLAKMVQKAIERANRASESTHTTSSEM